MNNRRVSEEAIEPKSIFLIGLVSSFMAGLLIWLMQKKAKR